MYIDKRDFASLRSQGRLIELSDLAVPGISAFWDFITAGDACARSNHDDDELENMDGIVAWCKEARCALPDVYDGPTEEFEQAYYLAFENAADAAKFKLFWSK